MKFSVFFLSSLLILGSCGSSKVVENQDIVYEEDKVLGRSDGMAQRPEWASETVSTKEEGDSVQFIGLVEVPGDSRPTAAFKMSDANAKGGVASKIETNVLKMVETSDSGLNVEDQSLKSLIHEMSQISLKNVDIKNRYWEKVQRVSSTGKKSMIMKTFSLIEIKKSDLQKMMFEKAKNADVPADMRNKVENLVREQW
jgi:hypothetical protein